MAERILIVEDDAALGEGLRLTLERYDCTVAPTLAAARQALAAGGWGLMILDLNLPDGSGLDLLRAVRRAGALPVLILTANDLEMDQVTGLELGADDYVTKPLRPLAGAARPGEQPAPAQPACPRRAGAPPVPVRL